MRSLPEAVVLWIAAALAMPAAGADGLDLHRLWDDRCFECHGHAGAFVRKYLTVSGDALQDRHHVRDLRRFLGNHYLAKSEVDAVYGMLRGQASRQARLKNEFSRCHGTSADFVRESLDLPGRDLRP